MVDKFSYHPSDRGPFYARGEKGRLPAQDNHRDLALYVFIIFFAQCVYKSEAFFLPFGLGGIPL